MSTIFLSALQKLLDEKLSERSRKLQEETTKHGYKHDLSRAQKEIVDKLRIDILQYVSPPESTDKTNLSAIMKLIDAARGKIQEARESYGKASNSGGTVSSLININAAANDFHEKMVANDKRFKFSDTPYVRTPENIVFYAALYYIGDNIFTPQTTGSQTLRGAKENRIYTRLPALRSLVETQSGFVNRKTNAVQTVDDLLRDNKELVQSKGNPVTKVTSMVSMYGIGLKSPGSRQGRFRGQFNLAKRDINAMTVEEFNNERVASSSASVVADDTDADARSDTSASSSP